MVSNSARAPANESRPPKLINSVVAALKVLEELSRRQPIGVSDLARAAGLPKSNTQRLLVTLEHAGWARRSNDGTTRWQVTARSFTVGGRAVRRHGLLDAARPVMEGLSEQTQETVHLVMLEERGLISIERIESPHAVRIAQPLGGWAPLHATSPGKAILSCLTDDERDRLLPDPLERYTETTITERAELERQLIEARHRGYATNITGEWRDGVAAAGAAIQIEPGRPIAGIAVSAPRDRTPPEQVEEYGTLVAAAAREINAALERTGI